MKRLTSVDHTQKRAIAITTAVALLFGAFFLKDYLILIAVAAIAAFIFGPMYDWLHRRMNKALSATLTFLAAVLIIIVPLMVVLAIAAAQVSSSVSSAISWFQSADLGSIGQQTLNSVNDILRGIPFTNYQVTTGDVVGRLSSSAEAIGQWLLAALGAYATGLFSALTAAIIFIYVFLSMLVNRKHIVKLLYELNPLGPEVTEMYLKKSGAMVKGTVNGQFIIAVIQGVTGAISIYLGGIQEAFFVFAIMLSVLSLIPLGSGIVTIPLGIGMMLFGNMAGGILVVAWHLLGVSNIDNILRPVLVPKQARLDSALMLLAVFAGISMFGFWGLVLGPVLMILIVTTVKVYLAVFRGIPIDEDDDEDSEKKRGMRAWAARLSDKLKSLASKPSKA